MLEFRTSEVLKPNTELLMIFDKYPQYRNKWNQKFWARGYYIRTVGDISEEAVRKYIEEQEETVNSK